MTLSTANIIAASHETGGWDNLAPTAGTWRNVFWDSAPDDIRWGVQVGKFTFIFERVVFKFTNLTPTIPPNAKIVSAVLRGAAFATTDAQSFFTVIQVLAPDLVWSSPSVTLWRSASGPGPPAFNFDADVVMFNLAAIPLVDTAIASTHRWQIRDNAAGRYQKTGQGVTLVTGGFLGFVDISLGRQGPVLVGNIWAEIYSQNVFGMADTLLATSDTRPASAAPAPLGVGVAPFRFTFSGADQIFLTAGNKVVVVLNGDYPVSATDNVGMGWAAGGYAPGTFQVFGTGVAFDDQNYPMQRNFRQIAPSPFSGFVVWTAPQFFVGVDYDTPNLAAILQVHLLSGLYAEGDPLGFSVWRSTLFFPPGVTAQRRWAQFGHATLPSVRLVVEWKERAVRVSA